MISCGWQYDNLEHHILSVLKGLYDKIPESAISTCTYIGSRIIAKHIIKESIDVEVWNCFIDSTSGSIDKVLILWGQYKCKLTPCLLNLFPLEC